MDHNDTIAFDQDKVREWLDCEEEFELNTSIRKTDETHLAALCARVRWYLHRRVVDSFHHRLTREQKKDLEELAETGRFHRS